MSWVLREGVSLHPMPFGGAFVLDDARLAVRQIGSELAALLADSPTGSAGPVGGDAGPAGPVHAEAGPVGPVGAEAGSTGAVGAEAGTTERVGAEAGSARPAGAEGIPAAPGHGATPSAFRADDDPAAARRLRADATPSGVSPALAAEIRLGVEEGWLIHQEETA